MGYPSHTRHYIDLCRYWEDPLAGTIPPGYEPTTIAGICCYSNHVAIQTSRSPKAHT